MNEIERYRKCKADAAKARAYLSLIGKPERTTARGKGYLASISASVTIHHQETDGAANYHKNEDFDAAFSEVLKKNFSVLANETLAFLDKKASDAAHEAKEAVERLRDEIAKETDDARE